MRSDLPHGCVVAALSRGNRRQGLPGRRSGLELRRLLVFQLGAQAMQGQQRLALEAAAARPG